MRKHCFLTEKLWAAALSPLVTDSTMTSRADVRTALATNFDTPALAAIASTKSPFDTAILVGLLILDGHELTATKVYLVTMVASPNVANNINESVIRIRSMLRDAKFLRSFDVLRVKGLKKNHHTMTKSIGGNLLPPAVNARPVMLTVYYAWSVQSTPSLACLACFAPRVEVPSSRSSRAFV